MKSTVLIVDDSATQRLAWVMEFTKHPGLVPMTARDGVQALELARELKPDLVVTDLDMPHMDGETLVRELKAIYPGLRIFVVSASVTSAVRLSLRSYPGVTVHEKIDRRHAVEEVLATLNFRGGRIGEGIPAAAAVQH